MIATETTWVRVTKRRPCPICERPDWCGVSDDGVVAHCMRVESPKPTRAGGWIHRLADPAPTSRPRRARRPAERPEIAWVALMSRYTAETLPGDVRRLAGLLGVSTASLKRLGVAWAAEHHAWAIPMQDAGERVIGIRLRPERGKKWAVRGSHNGLFVPDGGIPEQVETILVAEGPTDVAALLDLGFCAIGRASCSGQVDMLVDVLYRRNVVIVADRDEAKKRPDGSEFYPGQEGAERLAEALFGKARTVKVIKPLQGKDAREWKLAGATGDIISTVIRNSYYWRPKNG